MTALIIALLSFGAGAAGALVFWNHRPWSTWFGVLGTLGGCLIGIVPAVRALLEGRVQSLRVVWNVPYGSFSLRLDPLSAFFLIPVFLICALAAIYGADYLEAYRGRKALAAPWFFFNLLVASMVLVILSSNGILFLMAWEMMALSSFFLVTFEDENESTRQAGWIYLVASHIGTAFLIVLFILLSRRNGSLDFDQFTSSSGAGFLLILALAGFGTKAGFIPFHVWLPEAHPAAPSHVSAVMSGVMITTGIYGLLRIMMILGTTQMWWGVVLCGVGLTSGIGGVLLALAQQDLKRLLAYSTVENSGIVALGLGIGMIGLANGIPAISVVAYAGAFLHLFNHSLFKGLLFLNAGNVAHSAHTKNIDRLGGLLPRMPWTGASFLVGAVSISALPPFNGFVGEFLIYLASFRCVVSLHAGSAVASLVTIPGLALIGALAAACFAKAFGITFLGQARTENAKDAHEVGLAMLLPGMTLAAGCIVIGFFGAYFVDLMAPLITQVTGLPAPTVSSSLSTAAHSVASISLAGGILVGLVLLLALARQVALGHRSVRTSVTWDCGYALPSSRMQYTASSFAQPLTDTFDLLIQTRQVLDAPIGLFPKDGSFTSETPDPLHEYIVRPLFCASGRSLSLLGPLQQGKLQLYILYIALTLLLLLLWQLA